MLRSDSDISPKMKAILEEQHKINREYCIKNGRYMYDMLFSENGDKPDSYFEKIFEMAQHIIEEKDYSALVSALISYDMSVKNHIDSNPALKNEDLNLPFWCCSSFCCDTRNIAEENN